MGAAELGLGHADAAINQFRQAIDAGLHIFIVYEALAAAYAQAGKLDEAQEALAEAREKLLSIDAIGQERQVRIGRVLNPVADYLPAARATQPPSAAKCG